MQRAEYCLNNVKFSPALRTLATGDSSAQLDPKVADLLLFLIEQYPEVLSRDEILDALWQGQDVSDHVVTQTISELRKALEKVQPDAKHWVKTISKRGYCLAVNPEASVETQENKGLPDQQVENRQPPLPAGSTFARKAVGIFTALALLIITAVTVNHFHTQKTEPSAVAQVLYPERVSFLVFESVPSLDFMAFGLSDFLNYRINTASDLHSTLVFNPKSELLTSTGTIVKGKILKDGDVTQVEVVMHNNIKNEEFFRKIYPLSNENLVDTQELIIRDILPAMNEQPTPEALAIARDRYPSSYSETAWMHQAHYALNQSDPESLSKSVALYSQVLQQHPGLEIAVAEQLIAIKLLRDMGDHRFSLEDLIAKNNHLTEVKSDIPPPVLHEAKAIFHFNINDLSIAQFHLNQATDTRESWLSNVIAGKIHESKGHNFKAGQSYAKAYSMKPDQGTLIAVENLLFKTDISEMLNIAPKS